MYDKRADDYDASWHPQYTERFMQVAKPQQGDRILDLACGTGLEAAIAAPIVGDEGLIVGVDATDTMLEVFRRKLERDPALARRIKILHHDATDLPSCAELERGSFDLILCSNAFVLFDEPAAVVAQWRDYLKPGGRMVIDITHEHNLRQGLLMEIVAERLGVPFPANRRWVKSKDSFKAVLEEQGLIVEQVAELDKIPGERTKSMSMEQADEQFDYIAAMPLSSEMSTDDFKARARPLFREEWEKASVDGMLDICDVLYVYITRKA